LYFVLYCTLCCVFVYFYFNPAFGLQLSLIKLSYLGCIVFGRLCAAFQLLTKRYYVTLRLATPSVVCDVSASYSDSSTFPQYFAPCCSVANHDRL